MDGGELKALRQTAGLKAYMLATALDISPTSLSRYENGKAPIPRMVELAAKYLCEQQPTAPSSAQERLVKAIREVVSA